MASPLFFERLRHDLGLELFLQVHLLQTPDLFFELLHARHHRQVLAVLLGAPLVERRHTHTHLSANVRHRKDRFNPFDRIHALADGEF
jgi:hypothetical protein